MAPSAKKPCSVCGEVGDGAHFGAEACRACAAFFRRSVALGKKYTCRSNGNCIIQSNVRCMCRSCRFIKCLSVGMRKEAVQKHRDSLGRRDLEQEYNKPIDNCPADLGVMPMDENGMPILNKLNLNYLQMDNVRKVIHNRDGESVFTVRQPRAVAYKEANAMHLKELNLVADWVINSYPGFDGLPSEQKKLLFRNFFLPFMILESGYYCCINDRTDIIILPSGDYIDCARPETFYHDLEGKQLMTSEDAVRMFGPSFEIYRRNILDPMRALKVDNYEFFVLCSLVLWDHGLEGQSEDCARLAHVTREEVIREVLHYYRRVRSNLDPSMRLASLLVLLPALQRSVRRFQEDVEISHVFNVYSVEDKFYELVNGRLFDSYFSLEMTIKGEYDENLIW